MLNLFLVMKSLRVLIPYLLIAALSGMGMIPPTKAVINSPRSGDVLQGIVSITGSSTEIGFKSYEVSFAYEEAGAESWFLLNQGQEPVSNDLLATWDTTTIADGKYKLRVQVFLEDGGVTRTEVSGLQVRNYTPAEVATDVPPQGDAVVVTPNITVEATESFYPRATVTPLPANPAEIRLQDLSRSLTLGGVFTAAGFILYGLYQFVRGRTRRHK